MSAAQEYICAVELINQFFARTRDEMFMSQYEASRMEKEIEKHIGNMVSAMRNFDCKKILKQIPPGGYDLSARNELVEALKALDKLYELAEDKDFEETWYLKFLVSDILARLKNIKRCHDQIHENRYTRDYVMPMVDV